MTVPNVSQSVAFERAAKFTTADGWHIQTANKDLGIISAAQTVTFGNGKTAPLSIVVDEASSGVEVSISFATSGGVSAPLNAIVDHFCKTIESVER